MIVTEFNLEKGILESKFVGEITLTEIVNFRIKIKEKKTYPRILKIKTDISNANFKFSEDDLETIVIENDKSLENYNFIIEAVIAVNPQTTAFSILYQKLGENDKYNFNVFSTEKGASMWLENN